MPKVKICGITNAQDALWAANLGADFIGLNFYGMSPRKVSVKHAKELVAQMPPFVTAVGIFVDEPFESLAKIVKSVPLKVVQLHGMEVPEYCQQVKGLGVKIIKALRLTKPYEAVDTAPYEGIVDYFLFDTFSSDSAGGTGETFSWDWLQTAASLTTPWFLAGGLTPSNILEAVKKLRPLLVDVCSGVEKSPTRKDYEAMKSFIQSAKSIR
jgi:phosphoribosylanthranilate isomerase